MKIYIIIILSLIFCKITEAQKFKIKANIGYGTYKLENLKEFQNQSLNQSTIKSEPVISFPSFRNYSLGCQYSLTKKDYLGLDYSYYFTGAKNDMQDYSADYKVEMPVKANRVGISYQHALSRAMCSPDLTTWFTFTLIFDRWP